MGTINHGADDHSKPFMCTPFTMNWVRVRRHISSEEFSALAAAYAIKYSNQHEIEIQYSENSTDVSIVIGTEYLDTIVLPDGWYWVAEVGKRLYLTNKGNTSTGEYSFIGVNKPA